MLAIAFKFISSLIILVRKNAFRANPCINSGETEELSLFNNRIARVDWPPEVFGVGSEVWDLWGGRIQDPWHVAVNPAHFIGE